MVSNLPPGVTDSMLPGNTAADRAYETLCEEVGTIVPDASEKQVAALADLILAKCDLCVMAGYTVAMDEVAMDEAGADI